MNLDAELVNMEYHPVYPVSPTSLYPTLPVINDPIEMSLHKSQKEVHPFENFLLAFE